MVKKSENIFVSLKLFDWRILEISGILGIQCKENAKKKDSSNLSFYEKIDRVSEKP